MRGSVRIDGGLPASPGFLSVAEIIAQMIINDFKLRDRDRTGKGGARHGTDRAGVPLPARRHSVLGPARARGAARGSRPPRAEDRLTDDETSARMPLRLIPT